MKAYLKVEIQEESVGYISKDINFLRYCQVCAVRNFYSCQRIVATGSENEVKRKAELAACKDVGYNEKECTLDKIKFVECGIEAHKTLEFR